MFKEKEKAVVQKKTSLHSDPRVAAVEKQSGLSFKDVKIHYASSEPKKFGALAFAYGNDVHLGPGQEKHLNHELGHVMQQKQGIVTPTHYENGYPVNDSKYLESSASYLKSIIGKSSAVKVIQKMPPKIRNPKRPPRRDATAPDVLVHAVPAPVALAPVAPTPVAPVPVVHAPVALAPTPVALAPVAPAPVALAPTPIAHAPRQIMLGTEFTSKHLPKNVNPLGRVGDHNITRGRYPNTVIIETKETLIAAIAYKLAAATSRTSLATTPDYDKDVHKVPNKYRFTITVTVRAATFGDVPQKDKYGHFIKGFFNILVMNLTARDVVLGGSCTTRAGADAEIDHCDGIL